MESFFRETETVKYDTFTSETEVGQARDALNDISKRHAGALSEGQRRLVKQIEEGIQKKVDQLTEEANGWLRRTEALVEKGKELDRLVQILASPPPFLQKAKLRTAERLRAEAQQRFDADESEQVICHFKRITDKEQKQKVLRELEKLLSTASE
jgi:hypothetical protein